MAAEYELDEPLYSCVVPLETITGNQTRQLTVVATTAAIAGSQAQQMLAVEYGCNEIQIQQLMKFSKIEYLFPWSSLEGDRS